MENGFWRMAKNGGVLTPSAFCFERAATPEVQVNQLLIRTRHISLDPYLARAMRTWQGEVPGWKEGIIHGRIVGEVLQSNSPDFSIGDIITGVGRWQTVQTVDAHTFRIVPDWMHPATTILGVFGASGLTAWTGLHLAQPINGETILVSAATGPVGSVVGQIARARGLHPVGIAGGPEKCRHATEAYSFVACIDYREPDLEARLGAALPDGADIVFENVGGTLLDAALCHVNHHARVMLCGLASHYNDDTPLSLHNFRQLLYRAVTLRGFITAEHANLYTEALAELRQRMDNGQLVHDETIIDGIENAPKAYLDMLSGTGLGKRIIRV